jgi:hypothetical protein
MSCHLRRWGQWRPAKSPGAPTTCTFPKPAASIRGARLFSTPAKMQVQAQVQARAVRPLGRTTPVARPSLRGLVRPRVAALDPITIREDERGFKVGEVRGCGADGAGPQGTASIAPRARQREIEGL